jgi:phosphopantetheinyl transferase
MKNPALPTPLPSSTTPSQAEARIRLPLAIPVRPYLRDHHFLGKIILPAVEILQRLAGSLQAYRPETPVCCMRRASFDHFLEIDGHAAVIDAWHELEACENGSMTSRLMSTITPQGKGLNLSPYAAIKRTKVHAAVDFAVQGESGPPLPMDLAAALDGMVFGIPAQALYRDLVPFGPAFQNVTDTIFLNENGALCRVLAAKHPASVEPLGSPFPLDGVLHAACAWGQRFHHLVAFPVGFEQRRVIHPTVPGDLYHGTILPLSATGDVLRFDIWIFNGEGDLCEEIRGVTMKDVSRGRVKPPDWVLSKEAPPLANIREHSRALSIIELNAIAPFAARALSPHEQERFERMGKVRQKSYLAGRLALKHLTRKLAQGDRVTPASAIHTIMPDGTHPCCPVPGSDSPVFCSLSHDRRYAIAVADDEAIGVDVEQISERGLKAGRLYMGKEEMALTAASSLGEMEASMRIWSIKEGMAKIMDWPLAASWASVRVQATGRLESRLSVDGVPYRAFHDTVDGHLFTLVKKGKEE